MGYIHGSNLLVLIGVKPIGQSKSCKINRKSETKSIKTKDTSQTGLWDDKKVSKNSVSITTDGFVFRKAAADDIESGYEVLKAAWYAGEPVTLKYAERGKESSEYETGQFIITAFDDDASVDDDATYSASFENSGEVSIKTPTA